MSNPFLTNSSRVSKLGGDGGINYQKQYALSNIALLKK